MTTSEILQLSTLIATSVTSWISIIIAVKTLKQNSKMITDNTRAHILFYIDYHPQTNTYYLVIKNFGNSTGKLKYIEITPNLDWNKTKHKSDINVLTNTKDLLLAPNQKVSSYFEFEDYPDTIFDVKLAYETQKTTYTESYTIDLSYIRNLDWLHSYSFDDDSKDYKNVLYKINNSILEISQKD